MDVPSWRVDMVWYGLETVARLGWLAGLLQLCCEKYSTFSCGLMEVLLFFATECTTLLVVRRRLLAYIKVRIKEVSTVTYEPRWLVADKERYYGCGGDGSASLN